MEEMVFVYKTLFEKRAMRAYDDKVVCEIKTLSNEYLVEYKYSDLSSSVIIGKIGDEVWSNIGWILLATDAVFVVFGKIIFPEYFYYPANRIFPLGLAGLSLIMFFLRLIFKYDCIWIKDKEGKTAVFFRLNKQNYEQGQKVKDFIVNQIKQVEKSTHES